MEEERSIPDGANAPISTSDPSLSTAIAKAVGDRDTGATPSQRRSRSARARIDKVFGARLGMIEGRNSDPNGYERLLGESDLVSINFLDRGRRSADAVCRIKLPMDGGHAYGTGFLVGPRLMLTNNHVLASASEAAQAEAQFGYEHDIDGVLRDPVAFNLDPSELFYTNMEHDFTLVAITPLADSGVPLDRFGWLPLIPVTGKVVDGEWVSIIQHPKGDPKQIAIHSSQIIKLDPGKVAVNLKRFIHYSTDTEPGSSGSPVFNDQWQVVALHHKAVPAPAKRGTPADAPTEWLANEGVRVSAIFDLLERNRFEDDNARRALDRLGRAMGFPPLSEPLVAAAVSGTQEQFAPLPKAHWARKGLGYDPEFLSERIDLEPIYKPLVARDEIAPLLDGSGHELTYWHFSSVVHARRKFPVLTVVNIDGEKLIHPGPRKDTWRRDRRIADEYQPDDEFYVKTKAAEKVYFSRGHLVRLLDPCWGVDQEESRRGMEDSFHFTNAAPQVQGYNDQDWGNLEDYLLDKAQTSERRLTVFTGPIYRDNDPFYGRDRKGGPWRIPLSFWKIAVLQKTNHTVAAAAFIIGQTEYVQALYEAKVFSGLKPYTIDEMRSRKIQTTVPAIEAQTGLDFSQLHDFDTHGHLETTRKTRWFNRLEDVLI